MTKTTIKPVKNTAAKSKEKIVKAKKEAKKIASEAQVPHEVKKQIIEQYQVKEGDTGSPEVQVALLSSRIEKLVLHLKANPSDNHSRRGLLGIVSKRRRLLKYLEEKNKDRYQTIIEKLSLSK